MPAWLISYDQVAGANFSFQICSKVWTLIKHLLVPIGPPLSIEFHTEVPCKQCKYFNIVNVISDFHLLPVLE